MAAYIIAEVDVSDPERFEAYRALAHPAIAAFDGTVLASSLDPLPLEGDWRPQRVVVVRFASPAQCLEFYHSPAYQAAVRVRQGIAHLNIIAVEGLAESGAALGTAAAPRSLSGGIPMPAYVIAEVHVTDPQKYETYKALAPDAIAKYGGRYLARGGATVVLEGDWQPGRIVILEFASLQRAQEFSASPEYGKARDARSGAAIMRILAVEGL